MYNHDWRDKLEVFELDIGSCWIHNQKCIGETVSGRSRWAVQSKNRAKSPIRNRRD